MTEKPTKVDGSLLALVKSFVSLKLVVSVFIAGVIGLVLVWFSWDQPTGTLRNYILREIGKSLFITALVSGAVKWYIVRQTRRIEEIEKAVREGALFGELEQVRKIVVDKTHELSDGTARITKQTELIAQQTSQLASLTENVASYAASLVALQSAGIARVYRDRQEAGADIRKALEHEAVDSIKILGISLNDFIRSEHHELHRAWRTISRYITTDTPPAGADSLNVRVMLLDSNSDGGDLRSRAEGNEGETGVGPLRSISLRLHDDVKRALDELDALRPGTGSGRIKVTFEVKVYRTAPILYLVRTPAVSFVQQYYFRPRHGGDISIPVLKYHSGTAEETVSVHEELDFHFDWIWKNAAITLEDYRESFNRGVDQGVRSAAIQNIFYDERLSRNRIVRLIDDPMNKTLWIKGVSLHSFFNSNDLLPAIVRAKKRCVDVRILLIDPDCEQARVRSFREFLIRNSDSTLDAFSEADRLHERLYIDTSATKQQILRVLEPTAYPNFKARMYTTGPEAFILLTDTSVLVEQYHYGKMPSKRDEEGMVLGGDVPLIEYSRDTVHPRDDLKDPYKLFRDHFDYVFTRCAKDIEADSSDNRRISIAKAS